LLKTYSNKILNEKYFFINHKSGFKIYLYPKKEFNTSYAILGVKYGSINNNFKIDSKIVKTPEGIAHFLEHKLFQCEHGDAFKLFSKTGASANAYTSFDKTAYLFSCSDNLEKSLSILLNFVQEPYFTDKGIEKERGIIEQEIKMYQDDPDWKVTINLLNAMYSNHPVKFDIAGSVESISKITTETLNTCYRCFYDLSNMAICVVGNFDIERVLDIVENKIKISSTINKIENIFPQESDKTDRTFISEKMEVINTIFSLGFKHINKFESMDIKDLIILELFIKSVTLRSGKMYNRLLEKELISTNSFGYELFVGPYYAASIFSGESKNYVEATEIIKEEMFYLCKNGIEEEMFLKAQKCIYADIVASFDSVTSIANKIIDYEFSNYKIFELIDIISKITLSDINENIKNKFTENNFSVSVIEPIS